jgi:hypothetical protein
MASVAPGDRAWLEEAVFRLKDVAWRQVSEEGVNLRVEVAPDAAWVEVHCDHTALLVLAASCLEGALSEGLWSHAVDKASYADDGSIPLQIYLDAGLAG